MRHVGRCNRIDVQLGRSAGGSRDAYAAFADHLLTLRARRGVLHDVLVTQFGERRRRRERRRSEAALHIPGAGRVANVRRRDRAGAPGSGHGGVVLHEV